MEAKNYRVGNIVEQPNRIGKISEVWQEAVRLEGYNNGYDYEHTKPILLTKKWLDNFCFDDSEYKEGYTGVEYRTNLIMDFVLTKPNFIGEWQNYYTYDLGQHRFVALHYVHELQNLFFALTGTELELCI
jgi:hypothetical protein